MSAFTKQFALMRETAAMAFDTLRSNKMRSALTVLGVVIGVTSIVGMTSLIRGFDSSLRDSISSLGPNTIFVQKFGGLSFSSGKSFMELMRRPNLSLADMQAIERLGTTVGMTDLWLGAGPGQPPVQRIFYGGERTRPLGILGTTEKYVDINFAKMEFGRSFTEQEVQRGRPVAVIGYGPYDALFAKRGIDPIGKTVRIGTVEYTLLGVVGKRPSPGGFGGADDFAIMPYTTFRKQFGHERVQRGPMGMPIMIAVLPREGVAREETMREVEAIMRIRPGLTLDKENDFDLVTSDAILAVWDQISAAILLALVVISSIALMVGGIGVMAIMTISVTERTREIGVRMAVGARQADIRQQFLIEAVLVCLLGGVLGIGLSLLVGWGFDKSGSSFTLVYSTLSMVAAFVCSTLIGVIFGFLPANNAAKLNPVDSLSRE